MTRKQRIGRLLLYAPNVHTGGGFVLLQSLLDAWPAELPLFAWLDARAQQTLDLPSGSQVKWVKASVRSRLGAQLSLAAAGRGNDQILCFHGLPPVLPNAAQLMVFLQNRNYLGKVRPSSFTWKTRLRLMLEQFVSKRFRHRVDVYWVQTASMAEALRQWFGPRPVDIRIHPFAVPLKKSEAKAEKEFDFVYIADGEAHKNHRKLIQAWIRLKQRKVEPSLALTLSSRDAGLKKWVAAQVELYGLRIDDLGVLAHSEMPELYSRARALVFPSVSESFGLPLLEAKELGLPILAGELDFVRDVCSPTETFDPTSAVSIERAVLRFLGKSIESQAVGTPADFLRSVILTRPVASVE